MLDLAASRSGVEGHGQTSKMVRKPSNPDVIMLFGDIQGPLRSDDNGRTWSPALKGLYGPGNNEWSDGYWDTRAGHENTLYGLAGDGTDGGLWAWNEAELKWKLLSATLIGNGNGKELVGGEPRSVGDLMAISGGAAGQTYLFVGTYKQGIYRLVLSEVDTQLSGGAAASVTRVWGDPFDVEVPPKTQRFYIRCLIRHPTDNDTLFVFPFKTTLGGAASGVTGKAYRLSSLASDPLTEAELTGSAVTINFEGAAILGHQLVAVNAAQGEWTGGSALNDSNVTTDSSVYMYPAPAPDTPQAPVAGTGGTATAATVNVTLSSPIVANDIITIYYVVHSADATAVTAPAFTLGAQVDIKDSTGTKVGVAGFLWKRADGSESGATVTLTKTPGTTGNGTHFGARSCRIRDCVTTGTPFVYAVNNPNASGTGDFPSLTLKTKALSLLLLLKGGEGTNISTPANWTNLGSNPSTLGSDGSLDADYRLITTPGTYDAADATVTTDADTGFALFHIGFLPADCLTAPAAHPWQEIGTAEIREHKWCHVIARDLAPFGVAGTKEIMIGGAMVNPVSTDQPTHICRSTDHFVTRTWIKTPAANTPGHVDDIAGPNVPPIPDGFLRALKRDVDHAFYLCPDPRDRSVVWSGGGPWRGTNLDNADNTTHRWYPYGLYMGLMTVRTVRVDRSDPTKGMCGLADKGSGRLFSGFDRAEGHKPSTVGGSPVGYAGAQSRSTPATWYLGTGNRDSNIEGEVWRHTNFQGAAADTGFTNITAGLDGDSGLSPAGLAVVRKVDNSGDVLLCAVRGSGLFYKLETGGAWTAATGDPTVGTGQASKKVVFCVPEVGSTGFAHGRAAVLVREGTNPGLYVTTDAGATWTLRLAISGSPEEYSCFIAQDPTVAGTVYMAVNALTFSGSSGAGVYRLDGIYAGAPTVTKISGSLFASSNIGPIAHDPISDVFVAVRRPDSGAPGTFLLVTGLLARTQPSPTWIEVSNELASSGIYNPFDLDVYSGRVAMASRGSAVLTGQITNVGAGQGVGRPRRIRLSSIGIGV